MTDANMPQVQNSPFSHFGNFAPCGAGALAREWSNAPSPALLLLRCSRKRGRS